MEEYRAWLTLIIFTFGVYTFYLLYQSRFILKKKEAKKYIKRLEKETDFFNEDKLYATVLETFETLQKAAIEKRLDIAKEYMSKEGFETWSIPLNWAIYNNERIYDRQTIINYCWIVSIEANLEKKDCFWVYIQGYHDKQSVIVEDKVVYEGRRRKIEKHVRNNEFREFWKFIRIGDQFYLDQMLPRQHTKISQFKSSIKL